MDWSLVLLSQGIESVIEHDQTGWVLLVDPSQLAAAQNALELYRRENRGWRWGRPLPLPELAFHESVIVWCIALTLVHVLRDAAPALWTRGVLDSQAAQNGAVWLLFTATTLHADIGHLLLNLVSGFVVLGLAIGRFGPGPALLASLLAGAAGNAIALMIRSRAYHGLGASGVVMGALGLLAFQAFTQNHRSRAAMRFVLAGVAGAGFLFLLLGTDPKSDVLAHAGGFAAGVLLSLGLVVLPRGPRFQPRFGRACLLLYFLLLTVAWTFAAALPLPGVD